MKAREAVSKFNSSKIAFVCSGGVVKAASWHLGVALALDELGFHFGNNLGKPDQDTPHIDTYVASSAGSLIALYLASGFTPHDIIQSQIRPKESTLKQLSYRDMLTLANPFKSNITYENYHPLDEFPTLVKALLKPLMRISGFFTTEGLHKYLSKHVLLSQDFNAYDPDLFIIGTPLDHNYKKIFGKYTYPSPKYDNYARYVTGYNIADAAAASMSVPPFYTPYTIKNPVSNELEYYIDGEIRDTLSSHVAVDNGCDLIICSWTHSPYELNDEIGSLANYGLPAICVQSIYLIIQKKIAQARVNRSSYLDLLDSISRYMKTEKISEKHQKDIISIIESKLDVNPKVKIIDINPKENDYEVFFSSNFSLNHESTVKIVRKGYKRTMEVFGKL